jgi:hypothetical protein
MRRGSFFRFAAAVFAFALLVVARPARAGDPYVRWYTLTSPHFRVHFHAGLEPLAQKVAAVAEGVFSRVTPSLGYVPTSRTEIVLTDDTEAANGLASPLPYPVILLYASAPDDMSSLGDYDDWVTELVTHEFTHIVQLSNTSGVPGVLNTILGPTFAPNQDQPHWIIEGLAVAMESEHTTAGRLRGTQFEMFLRTDVLAGTVPALDEISHARRSWPGGTLWYLYGSKFVGWIASIYGPDVYGAVATDYGAQIIPWGINRAIRRATSRTYEDLYAGFLADLGRRYQAEADGVRARGLREGRRVTAHGGFALAPRFLPASCGRERRVSYVRGDLDTVGGVYTVPLDGRPTDGRDELIARTSGRSHAWGPDCSLYFDGQLPSARRYSWNDLSRLPPGERSPAGTENVRERLTTSRRARDVDVAADGRAVVYVTNDRGTTTLRIAELTAEHRIAFERRLTPSGRFEQVYTPRFSPDGRRVAYGTWTSGGHRDIRIVDVETGRVVELWRDRAIDQQPEWSPDGKTLYFTSDRTGIANVYAYELATGALAQVTNVLSGAYMPAVSPDGRTLVYVGYGPDGFDLYELDLDRRRFLPALPPVNDRSTPPEAPEGSYEVKPYRAFPTVLPRAYSISYGDGTFGPALRVTTTGVDAIGRHGFAADASIQTRTGDVLGSVSYYYGRLPFDFSATLFRSAALRDDYRFGDTPRRVTEHQTGVTTGVSYGMPGAFDGQAVALSYTLAHWEHERPMDPGVSPDAPLPVEPPSGTVGIVRVGYEFSNASATPMAVSVERGMRVTVTGDFADPAWGSEDTLTAFSATVRGYVPMPWLRHHVLALSLSGGASVGSYAREGFYSTGGFADTPPLSLDASAVRQSGFVIRGYEPGVFNGSSFNLANAEYRFPIATIDRGVSTLPAFLSTVSGAVFFDAGGAYDRMNLRYPFDVLHAGVGAELWVNFVLAYFSAAEVRFGIARGLDKNIEATQKYFVAASQF